MKKRTIYRKISMFAGMDFSSITKEERNKWNLLERLGAEDFRMDNIIYSKDVNEQLGIEFGSANFSKMPLNLIKLRYTAGFTHQFPKFTFLLFNYQYVVFNSFLPYEKKESSHLNNAYSDKFYVDVTYEQVLRLFHLEKEEYTEKMHEEKRLRDQEVVNEYRKEDAIKEAEELKGLNIKINKNLEKQKEEYERVRIELKELQKEFEDYKIQSKEEKEKKRIVFTEERLLSIIGFEEDYLIDGIDQEQLLDKYEELVMLEQEYRKTKDFSKLKRVSVQKYILVSVMGEL